MTGELSGDDGSRLEGFDPGGHRIARATRTAGNSWRVERFASEWGRVETARAATRADAVRWLHDAGAVDVRSVGGVNDEG